MSVSHAFMSQKPDEADATLVRPSDWNADHVLDLQVSEIPATTTPAARAIPKADGNGKLDAWVTSAAVSSVFGRIGAVVAQSGDYTPAQVGADPSGTAASAVSTHETTYGHYTTAQKLGLEMEMEFKAANLSNYKTYTYTGSNLTAVDIWTTPAMATKLFGKALTYDGSNQLTQSVLTRVSDGATLTRTLAYTGANLTSTNSVAA